MDIFRHSPFGSLSQENAVENDALYMAVESIQFELRFRGVLRRHEHFLLTLALEKSLEIVRCPRRSSPLLILLIGSLCIRPFEMTRLWQLTFTLLSYLSLVLSDTPMNKRDDNLPARVPYVFPAPGTDPVCQYIPSTVSFVLKPQNRQQMPSALEGRTGPCWIWTVSCARRVAELTHRSRSISRLNAPLIAQAHSALFGVIRGNNTVPADMRELIVCVFLTL